MMTLTCTSFILYQEDNLPSLRRIASSGAVCMQERLKIRQYTFLFSIFNIHLNNLAHFATGNHLLPGEQDCYRKNKRRKVVSVSDFYSNRIFGDHGNMAVIEIMKTERWTQYSDFYNKIEFFPGSLQRGGVVPQLCEALQGEGHTSRLLWRPGKGAGEMSKLFSSGFQAWSQSVVI